MRKLIVLAALALGACNTGSAPSNSASSKSVASSGSNPVVVMKTSMGDIKLELFADKAPISVANFLGYVDNKQYEGTIFHRVIDHFMIQGGGFTADMKEKPTGPTIKNESSNGVKNDRGTIAMARRQPPDSATAQFYINVQDNPALNYPNMGGYTVFGKVIDGMDVVDKIKVVPTGTGGGMPNVPTTPVVISSVVRG